MAIAQQLQAESTEQNNTGQTVSVTLSAGSNRYMVVAIAADVASLAAPTSVTYGGNALALITDGSVTASQISTAGGVFMYRLLEASMPANGAQNLIVSWGATTNYIMGWWILTGVNQANAADVKILAETTTATTITVTLDAGATTDAVICAAYKNDTTGTVAITISGAGVTEDFDVSMATGGARGAAGTDLPAVASGTIACVATVSSTNRRIIAAIRLAEAVAPVTISGGFSTGATTVSGDVDNVAQISGGFSTGPVAAAGDVDNVATVGGGFSTGPVAVAGDVDNVATISGGLTTAPVLASGDVTGTGARTVSGGFTTSKVTAGGTATIPNRVILGAVVAPPVAMRAQVTPLISLSGGVLLGPITVSGDITSPRNISGDVALGAVQVTGDVTRPREISGGIVLGAVQVAGNVSRPREASGNIQLGAVLVSGSVRTQHFGTVALLSSKAGGAELGLSRAGAAALSSVESGSATLEAL